NLIDTLPGDERPRLGKLELRSGPVDRAGGSRSVVPVDAPAGPAEDREGRGARALAAVLLRPGRPADRLGFAARGDRRLVAAVGAHGPARADRRYRPAAADSGTA